ncbi:MAG: hypothetical protein V8Q58_06530 [Anaerobutyricum hallii]|uniref:hypothetical protein n=1 Tax=Anaerobutyricum hallii TaxID=39488 RepID=UPI00300E88E3
MSVTHDVDEMLTILQKRYKELKLKYQNSVEGVSCIYYAGYFYLYNHPWVMHLFVIGCLRAC